MYVHVLTLQCILQYSFVFTFYFPTFPSLFDLPVLHSFLLFQYKMVYPSFLFTYTCSLILILNSLCITSKRIFGRVNKHQHSTHSRCTSTYLLVKKHIWNRTDLGLEYQTSFSLFQFYNSILLCEIFFFFLFLYFSSLYSFL